MNVMCLLPLVRRDELTLPDDVSLDRRQQVGARQPRFQIEVRVERVNDEMIVMHLARRRRRAAIDRPTKPRDALDRAADLGRQRRAGFERNVLGKAVRARRNPIDHPVHERRRLAGVWILTEDDGLVRAGGLVAARGGGLYGPAVGGVFRRDRLARGEGLALTILRGEVWPRTGARSSSTT